MAWILPRGSVSLTIPAGQYIRIGNPYGALVQLATSTPGAVNGPLISVPQGASTLYGPYLYETAIVLNAGDVECEYEIGAAPVLTQVFFYNDASGPAAGLVGPGNTPLSIWSKRKKAMYLGDSLMDRNFTSTATENSLNGYGAINHANILLGQAFDYATDADQGVVGDTTTLVLARSATWTAVDCDVVFMSLGTNDYLTLTSSQTIVNLAAIFALIPSYKPIIYLPCPPRTFVDAATVAKWLAINKWLFDQQVSRQNLIVIDMAVDAEIDATSTQFVPVSGALVAGSAVHYNNAYAFKIGQAVFNKIRYLFPSKNNMIRSAADAAATTTGSQQLVTAGVLAGTGGTKSATGGGTAPSGTVVDGITVDHVTAASTCDSVCSIVARTVSADGDIIGSNQVVVIGGVTPAIAGDTFQIRTTGNLTVGAVPGDYIEGWADIKVSSHSNLKSVSMWIQAQTDGGTAFSAYVLRHTATDDVAYPSDFAGGIYRTLRMQIPAGVTLTGVQLRVELRFLVGGSATVKVGRPTVRVAN